MRSLEMKKTTSIAVMIMMMVCLFSCYSNAQRTTTTQAPMDKKILIVYLSRTNNTKVIAKIIQKNVGGDLIAIEMVHPYPKDYKTTVAQVQQENETGYLPPLKTKIDGIEQYDIVFIGFPTWGMKLPPPIKTFLNQYNLKGKTIVPFNSNAGYGIGSSFDQVKQLCPESKIMNGFSTKGGVERDGQLLVIKDQKRETVAKEVIKWLQTLALI
jgi:flavodoxin